MNNVQMIKLGGGLIAPKDWKPQTINTLILKRLLREIVASKQRVVIVAGSGNFGHLAVKKYGLETTLGIAKIQSIAQMVGTIVTQELLSMRMSAILISPHDCWANIGSVVADVLEQNFTPVLYGDGVWEHGKIKIASGEMIIKLVANTLITKKWEVKRVIQVSREKGVLDKDGVVIPEIDQQNWKSVKTSVGKAVGVDFTGGMLHKVVESLKLANKEVQTVILSGNKPGTLQTALQGKVVSGTTIH